MKHPRTDYGHIQDSTGKIHDEEPVLLLRGQDKLGCRAASYYLTLCAQVQGAEQVASLREHVLSMYEWPVKKTPDVSVSVLPLPSATPRELLVVKADASCPFPDCGPHCNGRCHGVDPEGVKLDECPYCKGHFAVQAENGEILPCPLGCKDEKGEGDCQACVGRYCTTGEGCVTCSNHEDKPTLTVVGFLLDPQHGTVLLDATTNTLDGFQAPVAGESLEATMAAAFEAATFHHTTPEQWRQFHIEFYPDGSGTIFLVNTSVGTYSMTSVRHGAPQETATVLVSNVGTTGAVAPRMRYLVPMAAYWVSSHVSPITKTWKVPYSETS